MGFLRDSLKIPGCALGLGVFAVGFLACNSTTVTATGPAQSPRRLDCDFEILTSTPLLGYQEIGTVDVTSNDTIVGPIKNLSQFKDHIRPHVCQLGGDAAIARANGDGWYVNASVMKRVSSTSPAAPAPVPVAVAANPESQGCAFDAQCKGDRICVEGKCQSPAPNAAPSESAPAPTTVTTAPVASASGPVTKLAAPATKRAASAVVPDSKSSAPAALPASKPASKSAN